MFQFLLDVLIRTADLALVAVGLSAVYALVKFPNVAHVQYAVIGAFLTLTGQRMGLPFAVAVVVSEETGRISIATEGQISRGFTAETLRARLTQLVLQRKSARRNRPRP